MRNAYNSYQDAEARELRERAEKAEARVKELEQKLRDGHLHQVKDYYPEIARLTERNRDMHDRAQKSESRVAALEADIRRVVPYVLATLPVSAHVQMSSVTTNDPEWTAVHLGRALSSRAQLDALLRKVAVDSGSTGNEGSKGQ